MPLLNDSKNIVIIKHLSYMLNICSENQTYSNTNHFDTT